MEEYIAFVLHLEFFSNVNEAIKKICVTFYRTYILHCYNMILQNTKFGVATEFPSEKCKAKNVTLRKM